jgi:hypothetical protein
MLTLESEKFCLCEAILMQDAKVWKEIRKAWFNVLVEGIMKDYESKKTLAQVSTITNKSHFRRFLKGEFQFPNILYLKSKCFSHCYFSGED